MVEGWKGQNTKKPATSSEDDTTFRFGGFAGDDEDDGEERRDLSRDLKTKKASCKMVSLCLFNYIFTMTLPMSPNPFPLLALQTSPFSPKQHWMFYRRRHNKHLLTRWFHLYLRKLDSRSLGPASIQSILDEVYGEGTYNVEDSAIGNILHSLTPPPRLDITSVLCATKSHLQPMTVSSAC